MARALTIVAVLAAGCSTTTDAPPPSTTVAPPNPHPPSTTVAPTTVATTVPVVTTTTRAARRAASEGMPGQDVTLEAIARCESGGNYGAENPTSTASGKYQVLDSTWDGYGGYERASDAPPEVQEAWAREAYARAGTAPWRASRGCWGRAA